ncbi:1-phosphofructokinase [Halapricum hydrolyticum]|uniref:1-phosphofructokinase family hexose kinase n=1 Tax=Halapricum hydrolyticum TaxID=2979991 RepID=A0AAE3ICQ4_9EURY|nr:1-phosphofructokinase [Halapricum hydrolyticum]MCU4718936.1 1-phosphofructokinase family hexose kinase [Halapricum hydrolyticum]MCU4727971.1 1-phosphofructokinase family hexose kinase [Halapricum hydrolyticum]
MILTVTFNPAVDHTLRIEESPQVGRVHRATEGGQFDAGGKGINVSQYLAALDSDTVATGLLGGFTGDFIRSKLSDEPFETTFVDVPAPTRVNTTILTADGEYKFNENGPKATEAAVDELLQWIEALRPNRVAVAGSLPPGIGPDAIDRIARAGPWKTDVDVGGKMLTNLAAAYDTCKPNEEELAAAVDREIADVDDAVMAARELLNRGYDRVVTSLGSEGAVLVTPDVSLYAEAVDTEVIDTVGAGDSLFAGVLSALERGLSEREALKTGIAVAGRVVATAGTSPPSFEDLESLRDEVDVRSVPLASD